MKRIGRITAVGIATLIISGGLCLAGGEGSKKNAGASKPTTTAGKKMKRKQAIKKQPGKAAKQRSRGATGSPGSKERKFQRGYAKRNGAVGTLKKGQRAQTKRQNIKGSGVRGEVTRATRGNRDDLQHKGQSAQLKRKRARMQREAAGKGKKNGARPKPGRRSNKKKSKAPRRPGGGL